ncbi:uncharacterized protein LOC132194928 [Neocloeon triangulifer]|uniref:uncharacterized protein LOC132194928 n=1 Tax=Neocloeon triangulifer TaxID=2078957 RepID=UPI00286F1D5E|nr:uncharacterized protein LOC132194928 [Neocloeon triangulifer]
MNKLYLCIALLLPAILASPVQQEPFEEHNDEAHAAVIRGIRTQSIGKPDLNVGAAVDNWHPDSGVNPEELGAYLEGDILTLPTNQGRNGIISTSYRWPNAEIYYSIQGTFDANQLNLIQQAINAYHANTCIRFKPYNGTQRDHLIIKSDNTGCWATVGRIGGAQYVNLQIPGCVTMVGTAIHELMHTVGFFHEHSRTDRDTYVNILWQNIQSGTESNFNIRSSTAFGVAYDYGSVMHYSAKSFSSNGNPTIEPKFATTTYLGQRYGFSQSDIRKINAMYNCQNCYAFHFYLNRHKEMSITLTKGAFVAHLLVLSQAVPLLFDLKLHSNEVDRLREMSWNISQGQQDYTIGKLVSNWTSKSDVYPEEMGSYHEGDILYYNNSQAIEGKNGIIGENFRWPGGVVYYEISKRFSRNSRRQITKAMNEYHTRTCIRFKKYTGVQRDFVFIGNEKSGCWAAVGRTGGPQYMNLQTPGCVTLLGTVIHELMHVVGFWHEQSRLDRDSHVKILWNNVRDANRHNFNKARSTSFGVPYDYSSVMHYSASAFSKNGRPTILPKVYNLLYSNCLKFKNIKRIFIFPAIRSDLSTTTSS